MIDFSKKKVLILGGASVHVKLVNAAKELGFYTIVTDNVPLDDSPGKKVSDEHWDINVFDVDKIVEKAKSSHIDGVISGWLDPCQKPYLEICEKIGLPCYGDRKQFESLTNKTTFKLLCKKCGVGIIDDFSLEDVENKRVVFPVFVKPSDSRGSRGQSVCYTYEELNNAIRFAKEESYNGEIIIERFISHPNEIQITYFYLDGTPHLIRTTDSYCGNEDHKLEKLVACSVSPSRFTDIYLETEHTKVLKMFDTIGIKNGPVFMQGFYHNGKFMFFDPGRRFPGVDFDLVYKDLFNVDFMKLMVLFSVYGSFNSAKIPNNLAFLNGQRAAVLFPTISAGKICSVSESNNTDSIFSILRRYKKGDLVNWSFNVNQRYAEIDCLSKDTISLKKTLKNQINELRIIDENGVNMVYDPFDIERIL